MNDVAVSQEDKTMGMIAHLSALVYIGPLIIWLINKDKPEKAFVTRQALEALNLTIALTILWVALFIINMILAFIPVLGWILMMILGLAALAIGIGALVLIIMAGIKANNGEEYRYPLIPRLIK